MPKVGLGTWKSPKNEVLIDSIKYAVNDAGYRHIDCAWVYGNEEVVGTALEQLFSSGAVKREDLWVTSKLWHSKHKPDVVEAACRQTLADLKLDYLDLYLIHHPASFVVTDTNEIVPRDANGDAILDKVPIADTWLAMERLVELGLVKHIGVSNFSIGMLEQLKYNKAVKIQPFVNQCEFHLYMQQGPMLWYLKEQGIVFQGYSCLGTNDWRKEHEPCLLEDEELVKVSKEVGQCVGSVELRFLQQLTNGEAVLIVKSVTPERIKSNISFDNFTLTEDQMDRLKARERCYRFVDGRPDWGRDCIGDGW